MPYTKRQAAKAAEIDAIIEQCRKELAMDFETPAEGILGFYGSKLGITSGQMREAIFRYNDRRAQSQPR